MKNKMIAVSVPLLIAVMVLTVFLSLQGALTAAGDEWDLNNFTTGVVIRDSTGNILPPGSRVTVGEDYSLNISFKEKTNLQFAYDDSGRLVFQMPPDIIINNVVNGAPIIGIGESRPVIGYFDITTDGFIYVWFDDVWADGTPAPANFIDVYTNTSFNIEMSASFGGDGGSTYFDFGNNVIITMEVDTEVPDPVGIPRIKKTASAFDPATKTVGYTVTVTADNGALIIDRFSDFSRVGNTLLGDSHITISNVDVNVDVNDDGVTADFTWGWLGESDPPAWGIDFNPAVTLAAGQSMTVTYTVDLTGYIDDQYLNAATQNYIFTVLNTAGVEYTTPDDDTTKNLTADQGVSVTHNIVSKTGTYIHLDKIVPWTVSVGDGLIPLNGRTITDTHGPGITMPDTITLTLRNQDNVAIAPDVTVITTSTGFTYDIPPASGFPEQDVYYVTASYVTIVNTDYVPPDGQVKNNITIDLPGNPEKDSNVNVGITGLTARKYAGWADEDNIQWICIINIPAGMQSRQFIFSDTMEIFSDFVTNRPYGTFTVTLDGVPLEEGEAPLKWRYGHSDNDIKKWDMYFDDGTDVHTSTWPIAEASTLVVTFTTPLSTPLSNGTYQTLGEFLKANQNHVVNNQLSFFIDGDYQSIRPFDRVSWPVFKTNTNVEDSGDDVVFSYQVILNGTQIWYESDGSGPGGNRTQQIFKDGGPAVFVDTFDERLEYVPDSFYAELYNSLGWQFPTYKYPDGGNPEVSGGTLTANLEDMFLDGSTPVANWYVTTDDVIRIHYQMRLPDAVNIPDEAVLKNSAGFTGNGDNTNKTINGWFTSDCEVKYGTKAVKKDMNADGNSAVFSIVINPKGLQLDNGKNLCLRDRMSNTLAFYMTSIRAYTEAEIGSGVFDVPAPLSQTQVLDPDTQWTWALTGENEITIVLPDETPVKITYGALIKGSLGETVGVENYLDVSGMHFDEYIGEWTIWNFDASGLGDGKKFLLAKNDAKNTNRFLPGAQFALYIAWPDEDNWSYGNKPISNDILPKFTLPQISDYTFYYLDDQVTCEAGSILFENPWLTRESVAGGAIFAVCEITTPPGYKPPSDPVTIVDLFSATGSDYVTLSNAPEETDVTINGEKKIRGNPPSGNAPTFTYNLLQVTDATGTYPVFPMISKSSQTTGTGLFHLTLPGLSPGITYYMITEAPGASSVHWTYDETVYIVRVTVSIDPDGELIPEVEYRYRREEAGEWSEWSTRANASNTIIVFTNTYINSGLAFPDTGGGGTTPIIISLTILLVLLSVVVFQKRKELLP